MKRNGSPRLGGCLPDPPDDRDYAVEATLQQQMVHPISYEPSMLPPRNQLGLGACVAFAATGAREAMEAIWRPRRLPQEKLSVLDLYKQIKEMDRWPHSEGTSPRFAMKVLQTSGQAQQKACPYATEFPPTRETEFWGKGHRRYERIVSYHRIRTIQDGRRALCELGPWMVGIPVGRSILQADGPDVLRVPEAHALLGGHALCIYGWDERGFLVQNSWGRGWRRDGRAVLPFAYLRSIPWWDGWAMDVVGEEPRCEVQHVTAEGNQ